MRWVGGTVRALTLSMNANAKGNFIVHVVGHGVTMVAASQGLTGALRFAARCGVRCDACEVSPDTIRMWEDGDAEGTAKLRAVGK